jgi:biotin carboxyl carrier protein
MPVTPAPAAPVTPAAALVPPVGQAIAAPMPGVILDIKVSAGDRVTNNQVVVLLEAMKMENEIITDIEGTVTAVHVTKGSAVNAGDALISVAG